jgi:hypothetical protein
MCSLLQVNSSVLPPQNKLGHFENTAWSLEEMDGTPYFAPVVSYTCKMFMKLTEGLVLKVWRMGTL